MTVRELIEKLQALPPEARDAEVLLRICVDEDAYFCPDSVIYDTWPVEGALDDGAPRVVIS